MFILMYDCPCGKKHKSRTTVQKHKKRIAGASHDATKSVQTNVQMDVQNGQKMNKVDSTRNIQGNSPPSTLGQSFIKEINLKGEFDRMTETLNPKKPPEQKPDIKCGACGEMLEKKTKHCPYCGVEFE